MSKDLRISTLLKKSLYSRLSDNEKNELRNLMINSESEEKKKDLKKFHCAHCGKSTIVEV